MSPKESSAQEGFCQVRAGIEPPLTLLIPVLSISGKNILRRQRLESGRVPLESAVSGTEQISVVKL
jgi:hypothetical protein